MPESPAPTYARVASITHWQTFFHQTNGIFRYPSKEGETIEHLDIDLRYVDHELTKEGTGGGAIHLPLVCLWTLRGGEFVQDQDERMELLAEVLAAINPIEVRWSVAW